MKKPFDSFLNAVEWEEIETPPNDYECGLPRATHRGVLKIGEFELRCYQLDNGQRIFDAEDVAEFFGWKE